MPRSLWRTTFLTAILFSFLLTPTLFPQEKSDIRRQIADAYGFSTWPEVELIRYTWNMEEGKEKVAHTWTWEPKTDRVTFEGKDKAGKPVKVTYTRGQMTLEIVKDTDPDFINDQYWLVFPFHLVWDKDATVEDKGMATAPMAKGKARKVTVTYPKKGGGYTPGDSYDLYVGANNRVVVWVYHESGTAKDSLISTWTDYKMAGPILVAHDHRGTEEGKPLRIYFTDVAVKLTGSDALVPAK